jgi:hypothetical protein
MNNFIGNWFLAGTFSENGQFEIIEDIEEYRRNYEVWLIAEDYSNLDKLLSINGLQLTVNADGTFTESKTGNPQIDWFDADGVLDSQITPFDGRYKIFDNRAFLTVEDVSSWAISDDPDRIRLDDGDTKICDSLRIVGENLIRTVSVITDELYTTRVLFKYQKLVEDNKEDDWYLLGKKHFATAYDNEPEYSLDSRIEVNPEYEGN